MRRIRPYLARAGAAGLLALSLLLPACSQGPGVKDSVILAEQPAPKLSDYGLFRDDGAREPSEGVIAYDLVNPLFSDYASKHRFVYVPEGHSLTYSEEDVFDFPVGSVLVKTFAFAPDMRSPDRDERYVETRLLIRKPEGWSASAYIWNDEQTDAVYAPVGGRHEIRTRSPGGEALSIDYAVPNRNQCKLCHSRNTVLTPIGPRARNLNHDGPYGGNQLADWTARGLLAGAPAEAPAAPAAFGQAPLEARARAWLDINCAHCHRAGGGASNSGLFLGFDETSPSGWGVHKRPVAAGRGAGDDLFVIEPGRPDQSIMVHRLASVEPGVLMPELGRSVTDREGLQLIASWIAAMPAAASPPAAAP